MTTVWLDPVARRQIAREAARFRVVETGGPLFGFGDEERLIVMGAGGPGAKARHRPMSFVPDRAAVAWAIDHVWTAGEQRYRYLGSWHTHPRGRPTPSGRDRQTAREMSHDEGVELARPLILIQSTWPTRRLVRDSDLRAHHWDPARDDLIAATLIDVRDEERDWSILDVPWDTQ